MTENEMDLIQEMKDFCFTNDVEYFEDLVRYAERHREDWTLALTSSEVKARMQKHLHRHSTK